jgi:hypothetical protein
LPGPQDGRNAAEEMPPAGIGGRAVAERTEEEPDGSLLPGEKERWRGA